MTYRVILGRLLHVDICDRAFVLEPFASTTYRVILGRLLHVDICDRAFVLEPFASMTYRAIRGHFITLTSAIERPC